MLQRPNLAVPLCHEEAATSYTSRLADYVGCETPFDLCRDLGLEWPAIVRGEEVQLRALAALGGANEDDLLRWSIRSLGNLRFQIGRDAVLNKTLLRTRIRLCPACVVNDRASVQGPYRRFHWDLISLRTCEIHGVPLIQLPHLEHSFGNYDFVKRVGACRETIEQANGKSSQRDFTAYEAYLLARLRGTVGSHPFLDALSLPVVTRLAETLGLALIGDRRPQRLVATDDLYEAGKRSFAYLETGEHGLLEYLSTLQQDPLQSNASHKIDFGAFWVWLNHASSAPDIERLRAIAREFVFSNYPISRGTIVLGQPCPKTRIYSVNSAKKEHGISRKRLVRCLVEFGAAEAIAGKEDSLLLKRQIRADDIDRILSHKDGFLSRWDAVALLGKSDKAFRQLRLNGTIARNTGEMDRRPRYDPEEITSFLAPIFAAVPRAETCPRDHVQLSHACQKLGTDLIGATDLIRIGLVRSARLLPNDRGLDRIVVDPSDLRAVLKAQMIPAKSKLAAAAYLHTSLRTIDHLIGIGELDLVKRGPSLKGHDFPAIPQASLDGFLLSHTTLGRIASSVGMHFMSLMHGLQRSGVKRVPVPKGIGRYYERNHLKECAPGLEWDGVEQVDWDTV